MGKRDLDEMKKGPDGRQNSDESPDKGMPKKHTRKEQSKSTTEMLKKENRKENRKEESSSASQDETVLVGGGEKERVVKETKKPEHDATKKGEESGSDSESDSESESEATEATPEKQSQQNKNQPTTETSPESLLEAKEKKRPKKAIILSSSDASEQDKDTANKSHTPQNDRPKKHKLQKPEAVAPANSQGGLDGYDGFYKKRLEISVSLLPSSLGEAEKHVEESIQNFQLKYSDGVGGVILAFDDMEILDDGKGFVLNELPYAHYTVVMTALVFSPAIGCRLSGTVTESFHSHISLVVCGHFNASISAKHLRSSGFEFDGEKELWFKGEPSRSLSIEEKVTFTCSSIHESEGVMSIGGSQAAIAR